jgi:hypothetical protein
MRVRHDTFGTVGEVLVPPRPLKGTYLVQLDDGSKELWTKDSCTTVRPAQAPVLEQRILDALDDLDQAQLMALAARLGMAPKQEEVPHG